MVKLDKWAKYIVNYNKKRVVGLTNIRPQSERFQTNAGIENILRTLAGVNSNNELSTQITVRGGKL
jgi:hypothetical protein